MNHHIPPRSLDTLVSKNSEMNRSPLLAQFSLVSLLLLLALSALSDRTFYDVGNVLYRCCPIW